MPPPRAALPGGAWKNGISPTSCAPPRRGANAAASPSRQAAAPMAVFFNVVRSLLLRRVPDGRCIGAFLLGRRHAFGQVDAVERRVVGGPARRRDLEYANVIERPLLRIEFRVLPVGHQER